MSKYSSILTQKLTHEVIHKYLMLMVIFFIVLMLAICPVLSIQQNKKNIENTNFINSQYEQTLNSIESQMDSLLSNPEIIQRLKEYQQDPSSRVSALIEQALQTYVSSFRPIHYCMIETENNTSFSSFSNGLSPASSLCKQDPYYQKLKDSNYYSYYSRIYTQADFSSNDYISDFGNTVFLAKRTQLNGKQYIFTLFYNVDNLIANCNAIQQDSFQSYYVFNRRNQKIYSTNIQNNEKASSLASRINGLSGQFFLSDGIYHYKTNSFFGWTVMTHITWFQFFAKLYPIIGILLLFFILIPIFFYKLIVPLNNQYLQPLAVLTTEISEFSAGDDVKTNIKTGDEIEILSTTVDKMIKKINVQIEDIKIQEQKNCQTEYSLLATQIDPHFIYNTLNIINILARQNGQDDILAINTALGKILKERFSAKATIFDEIENEIDTIKQYCTIMKYRYQNHIFVDINAESSLLHHRIPKNLLLPIVENSFYHGLFTDDGVFQGNIDISIYCIDDSIIIEISDNGKGISPEKLEYFKQNLYKSPDTDRTHIGLANVYQRLGFIYHDCFSFDISSSLGYGTTCSITIPLENTALNQ